MNGDESFGEAQKQYLQGFVAGIETRRTASGRPRFAAPAPNSAPADSDDPQRDAQDRLLAAGGKLSAEEQAKRAKPPLDLWDELRTNAAENRFPKGTDVFLTKFHGLFYVAPAQDSFMCRLRLPGGILGAHQLAGVADIAERLGGGFLDVTTRANLQMRDIAAASGIEVLTRLFDLGIINRGAGADNIRNITGSPTAGIDLDELIDTRPLCRELHHYILQHRDLYGLPRKFNIAFDGGGRVPVLEDTNDIGFVAARVRDGFGVPAGLYFRMELGGITGHGDFARDTGVYFEPAECVPAAAAVIRVFIAHGDRGDRRKARLKYLLDGWGQSKFMAEAEKIRGRPWRRLPAEAAEPRRPALKHGHIGVHAQKQAGLHYVGVALPVGRMTSAQARGLAGLAARYGSGTIRLTVWQNLLVSDIRSEDLGSFQTGLDTFSLDSRATSLRAGLVACTGNTGCKFAATNTKGQAAALVDYLEPRIALDVPVNIHLTGCHHSCAQHYIGDIGLLGARVARGEESIEGYHVFVGGGAGAVGEQAIARQIASSVPFQDLPPLIERMLTVYLRNRANSQQSFHAFCTERDTDALKALFAETA